MILAAHGEHEGVAAMLVNAKANLNIVNKVSFWLFSVENQSMFCPESGDSALIIEIYDSGSSCGA